MASSQVEIASSSSSSSSSSPLPFGCVLRDHNRRARVRWNTSTTPGCAFHNNFNDFVHTISGQPPNPASHSSNHHINHTDLWVHTPSYNIRQNHHSTNNACDTPQGKIVFPCKVKYLSQGNATSQNRGSSAPVTPFCRDSSPDQSDTCLEIPNSGGGGGGGGGISSLVQKWRDFEAESKTSAANNSPLSTTRSNSGSTFSENVPDEVYESTQSINEDSFGGRESDRTPLSAPTSSQGRDSDVTDNERLRVVDIIRKLTDNNNDGEHGVVGAEWLPRVRTSYEQSSEQRPFSPVVVGSPRLRGRQAFCDLLMQMERDRHKELQGLVERKPVSRFSHKGRIQAMLRVQLLRRGAEVKHCQQFSTASQSNRLAQSSIMKLREKFKPVSQHVAFDSKSSPKDMADNNSQVEKLSNTSSLMRKDSDQEEVTASTCPYTKAADNIQLAENSCKTDTVAKDSQLETKATMDKSSLQAPCPERVYREASPMIDVLQQRESVETKTGPLLKSAEARSSFNDMKEDFDSDKEDAKGQQLIEISKNSLSYNANVQPDMQLTETSHNRTSSFHDPPCNGEDECASNHYLSESEHCFVSDVSHTQVGWEEAETSQNWTNDISRPHSEWEGLRQERYQEMLDPFMENEEICQLLQRKSVSSFLSSGLRETIDRLMNSRTKDQPNALRFQTEKEIQQFKGEEGERENRYEVEREGEQDREEEEEDCHNAGYDDDYEDNEEDEKSQYGQYDNFEEYADQMTPSLPSSSWNHNLAPEASDNSDQVASPLLHQNTSPNSYSFESRPCSSVINNSSIEMELIFELRGHMEQLHQEMFELRKSIKSCMNMQLELQRSAKQEVSATLGHSGERNGGHSTEKKDTSKGICCVCYQMEIDSLLYRCGHMCTCLKCGHKLQWNSGRCPVCEAPIIDVVRVYAHS